MSDEAVSLILSGGQVLTMAPAAPVVEAVAVRGNEIVATGAAADVRAQAGPATRVVELDGRAVLPGINDSCLHGAAHGVTRPPCAFVVGHPAVASIADIAKTVGRAARTARPGDWLVGPVWDAGDLAECRADPRRLPHRGNPDAVVPQNPVCLTDFSSHMVWVNGEALRRCGIDSTTDAPAGGVIDLGPDGEPTGGLREAAQELVQAVCSPPPPSRNGGKP